MLLVVNFHYVRNRDLMSDGVRGVDAASFRLQLEEIARSFEFVSATDIRQAAADGHSLPQRSCLITFDDGLREQYDNAWPVMRDMGITGLFFVSPELTLRARVATVHRAHILRGAVGTEALVEAAVDEMGRSGATLETSIEDLVVPPEQYKYDAESVRRQKYFLNFVVPEDALDRASRRLLTRHIGPESEVAAGLYMAPEMWRELASAGALGSHGMTHAPLAQLPAEQLRRELTVSKSLLEEHAMHDIFAVSYPYGGPTAVGPAVERAAQIAGYGIGFTMERAVNTSLVRPLLLGRLDANDAPGGSRALVQVVGDSLDASPSVTIGRRVWHRE